MFVLFTSAQFVDRHPMGDIFPVAWVAVAKNIRIGPRRRRMVEMGDFARIAIFDGDVPESIEDTVMWFAVSDDGAVAKFNIKPSQGFDEWVRKMAYLARRAMAIHLGQIAPDEDLPLCSKPNPMWGRWTDSDLEGGW